MPPHSRTLLAFLCLLLLSTPAFAAIKREIPPLKPPNEERLENPRKPELFPWFLGAGVLSLIVMILAWPRPPKPSIVETPADVARREFASQDCSSPFVVAAILRRYLLARFELPGPGTPTEEVLAALAECLPQDTALSREITGFLIVCDTAKFAPDFKDTPASSAQKGLAWMEQIEIRRRARALVPVA